MLRRHTPKKAAPRAATLELAQKWAGVARHGAAPARLSPSVVYPSLVSDFGLTDARVLHLTPLDERYYAEAPSAVEGLTGSARSAYEFFLRFRFAGDLIPPSDRDLDEEEYAGLAFSVALRLMGVTEGSGRFLSREGSNLWVKTTDGRPGSAGQPGHSAGSARGVFLPSDERADAAAGRQAALVSQRHAGARAVGRDGGGRPGLRA